MFLVIVHGLIVEAAQYHQEKCKRGNAGFYLRSASKLTYELDFKYISYMSVFLPETCIS